MRKRHHSLAGRLLLLFLVTALLLAIVVRSGFNVAIDRNVRDVATPHLVEYIRHLLSELGDPPTSERAQRLAARLPLQVHLLGAENWSSEGGLPTLRSRRTESHSLPDGTRIDVMRGRGGIAVSATLDDVTVLMTPGGLVHTDHIGLVILLTIIGLLAVLLLAYHASRRLFRPIETIQAGVSRIGAGELDHRLNITRRDELGELATSINAMADDIKRMLEAKRELLLAISHELRSPLTRARLNAELTAASSSRSALLADLAELEALLKELLESERLSGRHVALDRQAVDPTELLQNLFDESFAATTLQLEIEPPGTWLSLDATRIRLLVRNLLNNALRHTPPDEPAPILSSRVENTRWLLSVTNRGPGVASEQLARLSEPFYRADPSRQRSSGGVGLGLYLCRKIVEAHGGELEITSAPGEGTRVLVSIPIARAD